MSAARIEDNIFDVFDILDQAEAAHYVLLIAMLDKVGTGVLVVVLDRFEKRIQRNVVVNQRFLIYDHLVLLYIAAEAEHVGDPGHRA